MLEVSEDSLKVAKVGDSLKVVLEVSEDSLKVDKVGDNHKEARLDNGVVLSHQDQDLREDQDSLEEPHKVEQAVNGVLNHKEANGVLNHKEVNGVLNHKEVLEANGVLNHKVALEANGVNLKVVLVVPSGDK